MRRDVMTDPQLPQLRTVVDTDAMSRLFEKHFRVDYPERDFRVEGTSIEKVYYRLHKHCGVLHRVRLIDANGERSRHWFFVRHFPESELAKRYEKAVRKASAPASFWKPVSVWAEHAMVVWAFPHDPRLAQLPDVVNPDTVAKLIESNPGNLGLPTGTHCTAVRCEQIKYMPGKRVVLRFEACVTPPDGAPHTLAFFAKTYADQNSKYVFDAMEAARKAIGTGPGRMEIPRSTLHIDHLHTYWQEEWSGHSMSKLYGEEGIAAAIPRVATALAHFHSTPFSNLGKAFYIEAVGSEAIEDAYKIARFLPEDEERLVSLAERIRAAAARFGPTDSFPAVPIHGAFRMSQLLGRDDLLGMTDFDATALGDPHYDVAEFMSSLLYQSFRRGLERSDLFTMCEDFRTEYERGVSWTLDPKRLSWFISAFTLEKFHGTLKGLEKSVLEHIDDVFDLVERTIHDAEN